MDREPSRARGPALEALGRRRRLVILVVAWLAFAAFALYRSGAPTPTGPAYWGIDRADAVPGARELTVLASDRDCASGKSAESRVGQAEVRESADEVVISFRAKRVGGAQTCPSHASAVRRVKLAEPLGSRRLLDGGTSPPAPPCYLRERESQLRYPICLLYVTKPGD